MNKVKKNILTALKIALAAGLILYLISSGGLNLRSVGRVMSHPWWFSLVIIMWGLLVALTSLRWYLLLIAQGVSITFGKTLALNFIGLFFNLCLPGATGGDLIKCYYLASIYPNKKIATISTVLVDRVMGVLGLLLVGGISVLAHPAISLSGSPLIRTFSCSVLTVFIAASVGLILLLNLPISFLNTWLGKSSGRLFWNILLGLYQSVRVYRDHQSTIYFSLFLSAMVHTTIIVSSLIVGRIIGSNLSWRFYGVITPLGLIASAMPIAPAGLGVGEAAFEYLYNQVGSPLGGEIMAVLHLVSIFWGLVGLPFYLLVKKNSHQPAAEEAILSQIKGVG